MVVQKLRQLIFRKPVAPEQVLNGRKFIVTGTAENSLGYTTAKILLDWGGEVTITRRSGALELAEKLKQEVAVDARDRVYAQNLDISNAESVKAFSDWYASERKELDVLINSAGIHLDLLSKWKEPKLSDDGFEIQWRTNYLGTTHLTKSLLPLLLQSAEKKRDARIVNVVSMLHDMGANQEFFNPTKPYNSWNAYGQSKLGLIHFTTELQRKFAANGLQAYCLHPGEVFTNVASKGLEGNPIIEFIRNLFAPIEGFFLMTPFEGAQTQLLCATAPDAKGGEYYRHCAVAKAADDAYNPEIAAQLWEANEKWIATL